MKDVSKKLLTLLLTAALLSANVALAQTLPDTASSTMSSSDTAPAPSDTPAPAVPDATPPTTPPADVPAPTVDLSTGTTTDSSVQGAPLPVQDATGTQQSVTSDVLESTTNPESATTTDSTVIPLVGTSTTQTPVDVPSATSTPEVTPVATSTTTADVVAEDITAEPLPEVVPDVPVKPADAPSPAPVPLKEAPKPDYSFQVTGKQIPTKRAIKNSNGEVVSEEAVAQALTPHVDNAKGEVSFSGQCRDANFVVLVFKNQNDYVDDPRSYVVNRAYPCVNGAFSYSISELPVGVPNGNYYLLVGEEGKTGAWKPITQLTEITVNRNE